MAPLIQLDDVRKAYRADLPPAVDGLSLSVEQGEILVLLGPSGCGKTTTLRLLMGFERPDAGRIQVGGRLVADPTGALPPEARGIGIVFQDYALFPHLTVTQNIAFGLHRLPPDARRRQIRQALETSDLTELADRYPHELSGGQQQRVALARAMAPGYEIVLLDEPLSNLDADLRGQLRTHLRRVLKETARTAVLVTHDQDEAFQIADRVGILNRGRLEQVAPPEEIYHRPATRFVAQFVGEADFLPGTATAEGLQTEVGLLPNPRGFSQGTPVDVMIRPDDVGLVPDADGQAVVAERRFRGDANLYTVRLASSQPVHSQQPSTTILAIGTRVTVKATPSHLVAFAAPRPWL